jgi:hypothetical protein
MGPQLGEKNGEQRRIDRNRGAFYAHGEKIHAKEFHRILLRSITLLPMQSRNQNNQTKSAQLMLPLLLWWWLLTKPLEHVETLLLQT